MTDETLYQEALLDPADVCSNCLAIRLVERERCRTSGLSAGPTVVHERDRQHTEIDYVPSEAVSDSKRLFCECGVPDASTRTWADGDVDRERFRELLTNAVRSAARKGVTLDRERTLAYALQAYDDGETVDEALRAGLDTGSALATAHDDADTTTAAD